MASSLTPRPATQSSTALAISDNILDGLQQSVAAAVEVYADATNDNIASALRAAVAIQSLRAYFDDPGIKAAIIQLQDSPLGFRTDKDPNVKRKDKTGNYVANTAYDYSIVKEAAIEALLRGLQLVGNQFNIIANRFYCTREGYEALIRKASITDFNPVIGVPKMVQGGCTVDCSATWMQEGKSVDCSATIPVKSDQYSTADQLIGKATRKFLKRCYERMSGQIMPDDSDTVEQPTGQAIGATPPPLTESPAPVLSAAAPASPGQPLGDDVPVLSAGQLLKLNGAMNRQLSPMGIEAFVADVCQTFSVDNLAALPADQFTNVMGGLAVEASVDRWNRGCSSITGELILTEEQLAKLQPQSSDDQSDDNDDAQGALL
jgi:hypothetical protein